MAVEIWTWNFSVGEQVQGRFPRTWVKMCFHKAGWWAGATLENAGAAIYRVGCVRERYNYGGVSG